MASTLDLSNTPLIQSTQNIKDFFRHNAWTWGHYHEDSIILDATHPDFMPTLDSLATAIHTINDVRAALHIHIHNIEQANTPLTPLLDFYHNIIQQHAYFDGYNLHVFAHTNQPRPINIGHL